MYWSGMRFGGVRLPAFGDIMSRARYEELRRCLTVTDRTTLRPKSSLFMYFIMSLILLLLLLYFLNCDYMN